MAMHGVAGDDLAGQVEFLHQLLHGGDLVGFFIDFDVGENQRGIDRERTEHLPCLGVVEVVETALQRLAVERDDASLRPRGRAIQVGSVFAKDLFDLRRAEPVQDIADRRVNGRALPIDIEGFVQPLPVDVEVGAQTAIGICAPDHGENRKQQHVS